MPFCNILRVACVLLVVFSSSAWGQSAQPNSNPDRPGTFYGGRFIGFRPRHGQVHAPPRHHRRSVKPVARTQASGPRKAEPQVVRPSSVRPPTPKVAEANTPVAASAFQESVAAEAAEIVVEEPVLIESPGEVWSDDSVEFPSDMTYGMEPNVWVRADYLVWWTKGAAVPALATTSPPGTSQEDAGVSGRLNTSVLFGGGDQLDDSRSGGRITFGLWVDQCHQTGLEFSFLGLNDETTEYRGSNNELSILARPFRDVAANLEDARLIAFPDLVEGSLAIDITSKFETGEILLRRPGPAACWSNVDYYVGYRYAQLEDLVRISESTVSLADPTAGAAFQLDDSFESRSRFHGGQVGFRVSGDTAPNWKFDFVGKFALGNTASRTAISGQTVVTLPTGDSTTQPAGLLAQGTNSGVFETNEISSITEIGVAMRRQLDCGWSLNFGYNFLLWTDVLRASEQIDTRINVSQIPPGQLNGEPRPAFPAATNDFWAQGLSFGLEYVY